MTKFKLNQRISLLQNISQKGKIDNIIPLQGGYQYYEVLFDNGHLEVTAEYEIIEEHIISTPWALLANNLMRDYRNFLISTTLHKVRNTTSNTISSLKASRTIFYPYQYKPLVKFLKSDIKRILVADEVGLGKTIEAGHIMLELAARGNLRNALVICTNSLRDKWKFELQDKFNFILKKYDSPKDFIQDVKNDVESSKKSIFGVLNYEKFRNVNLQKVIDENGYRFDLLICDEAHKIRNSETSQHKGVVKIVDNSDAVVFLTATPIMTDIRNLFNLVKVLDKERYNTFDIFNNAIRMNRPFIKALTKLNANISLIEIAEELNKSAVVQEMTADEIVYDSFENTISNFFKEDDLYQRARNNMLSGNNSIENRVKIQQDLIELNSLNHLYTRTRKKDVMNAKDVVTREPRTILITLSDEEREIYNGLINEYDINVNLGLIQRKRQMSSCIAAFGTSREKLLNGEYENSIPDAKYQAFETIIKKIVQEKGKKLIVFAFFTNTLLYLNIKLKELGIGTEIIYGDIKDRTDRIDNFQHNNRINVLLSSEVGSEGIDLQFCDALVNYDLPWNPMVVEQRIGRIDRVGQKSSVINIYNLILKDTIEERIHTRLYERINLFRESLGDLEEILGESEPLGELISKGIESLYKTKLTEAQQNKELDRLCKAIENEKQTLKKISLDLSESFANDTHFQNEIESITKNNRYLTKQEIIKYIESIIRIELSSLQLRHIDDNRSEIEILANNQNLLFNFIEKYMDSDYKNPELHNMYRAFKRKNLSSRKIELTFDQNFAYENKKLDYVSAFHPLVNAITNYFDENNYGQNQAHKIAVKKELLGKEKAINVGYYILTIYRISVNRFYGDGRSSQIHYLKSALADINGENVQILNNDISDHIYGVVQLNGEKIQNDIELDEKFIQEVRPFVMLEMKKDEDEIRVDEEVKFLSSIKRRTQQEVRYVNSRISRMRSQIREGKGIEQILLSNIEEQRQRGDQLLSNLQNAKIEVSNSLISANLLQVI